MIRAPATSGRPAIPGLRRVCEAIIYEHVFSNADREVGGVLVGRFAREGAMPKVSGAIPAIAADEQRATLTFTQDSWEHVHRVLESDYAGDRIVGWYHSHPGFGIFLSGHDLFIHRNFFSDRSQIALVVDPIARVEGVFAWRRSKNDVDLYTQGPTRSGWHARGKDGTALVARSPRQPAESEKKSKSSPPYPLAVVALAVLASFGIAFAISFAMFRNDSPSKGGQRVTTVQNTSSGATSTAGKTGETSTNAGLASDQNPASTSSPTPGPASRGSTKP